MFARNAGQDGKGFFTAVLVGQPSWGFGDEKDDDEDDTGQGALEETRESPGPVGWFQSDGLSDAVFNFGPF